jgi:hypothetical protein
MMVAVDPRTGAVIGQVTDEKRGEQEKEYTLLTKNGYIVVPASAVKLEMR